MKKDARQNRRLKQKREYSSPFAEITQETVDVITASSTPTPSKPATPIRPPEGGEWDVYAYDDYAW